MDNFETRIREKIKFKSRICREEFITVARYYNKREYNNQMKELNKIFQKLVIEGYLYTVDRDGEYTFFRERSAPKMWNVRINKHKFIKGKQK